MEVLIQPLLDSAALQEFSAALQGPDCVWSPGGETAGWYARQVKHNQQLDRSCALHRQLESRLQSLVLQHPLVASVAFPRHVHGLLFSRSGVGEGYGRHVDNAWMAQGRSDLSFTVFLSAPDSYSGGDLVLELPGGEKRLRLPAGHAVLYPSTLLHQVEPVCSGERLVAVGWIESRIRRQDQRELLFELETARRLQFQRHGKDDVFDLLTRSSSNLRRLWDS